MRPTDRVLVRAARVLLLGVFATAAPRAAAMQAPAASPRSPAPDARAEVYVGGELEAYLRALQDAGIAPRFPWSVRGFGPAELRAALPPDSATHPWAARYGFGAPRPVEPHLVPLRAGLTVRVNSDFPFGGNDGPVWAGRGITTSVMAGLAGAWGPLSFRLAPVAFRAENRDFDLMTVGLPEERPTRGDGRGWRRWWAPG
ncbi:MAG TPA: hypothetical protein VFY16_03995, partial [Gemmatimonadaceae bacterium]|nr:hypothetical protein [Gemmatimonadaceae bacterium]